jgi:hypothetical protein
MNEQLTNYVNGVFAPYEEAKSVSELKADLLSDLQERFRELKAEGKDDETALTMTIESIGDIEQTVREVANLSRSLEGLITFHRPFLPGMERLGGCPLPNEMFGSPSLVLFNFFESSKMRMSGIF